VYEVHGSRDIEALVALEWSSRGLLSREPCRQQSWFLHAHTNMCVQSSFDSVSEEQKPIYEYEIHDRRQAERLIEREVPRPDDTGDAGYIHNRYDGD
jgi:hypothetical protein